MGRPPHQPPRAPGGSSRSREGRSSGCPEGLSRRPGRNVPDVGGSRRLLVSQTLRPRNPPRQQRLSSAVLRRILSLSIGRPPVLLACVRQPPLRAATRGSRG